MIIARCSGVTEVTPDHLLLAIVEKDDATAFDMLLRLAVPTDTLRALLLDTISTGLVETIAVANMQLSRQSKRVIDCMYDEARAIRNDSMGTGHLLLGIIRCKGSNAAVALTQMGVTIQLARRILKDPSLDLRDQVSDQTSVWPPPIFRPELEPAPTPKLPLQLRRITFRSLLNAFGEQWIQPKPIEEDPFDIPRLAEAVIRNARTKNSPMARITAQADGTHIEYYVSVSFQEALSLPLDIFDALIVQLEALAELEDADFEIASESDDEYLVKLLD